MPGPLPAAATVAALLLASPAGAPPPAGPDTPFTTTLGPPVATAPTLASAPGGGALLAWSGTADAAPLRRVILGRTVDDAGTPGPVVELAGTPPPRSAAVADPYKLLGTPARGSVAAAPALLARGDGRFLMAYSERVPEGGHVERTVRVGLVAADGPTATARAVGPAIATANLSGEEAAPALAWAPGRRWALVAWAQPAGKRGVRVLARRVDRDGRPLGTARTLVRTPAIKQFYDGPYVAWTAGAPTAAGDGRDGVLVVWRDLRGTVLRAADVDGSGRVRRVALGLRAALERRALGRRLGPVRRTAPLLLARPGRPPLLAYGADMPDLADETAFRAAALVASVPRPRAIRAVSAVRWLTSAQAVAPTAFVAEPGGGATLAWTQSEVSFGRGCGDDERSARRLDAALRPVGAPRLTSTGAEPHGPIIESPADSVYCDPPRGDVALARVRSGLLTAFPFAPYVDGRILPDSG